MIGHLMLTVSTAAMKEAVNTPKRRQVAETLTKISCGESFPFDIIPNSCIDGQFGIPDDVVNDGARFAPAFL